MAVQTTALSPCPASISRPSNRPATAPTRAASASAPPNAVRSSRRATGRDDLPDELIAGGDPAIGEEQHHARDRRAERAGTMGATATSGVKNERQRRRHQKNAALPNATNGPNATSSPCPSASGLRCRPLPRSPRARRPPIRDARDCRARRSKRGSSTSRACRRVPRPRRERTRAGPTPVHSASSGYCKAVRTGAGDDKRPHADRDCDRNDDRPDRRTGRRGSTRATPSTQATETPALSR